MIYDLQNQDVMSFSASTQTGNIDWHSDAKLDSSQCDLDVKLTKMDHITYRPTVVENSCDMDIV